MFSCLEMCGGKRNAEIESVRYGEEGKKRREFERDCIEGERDRVNDMAIEVSERDRERERKRERERVSE